MNDFPVIVLACSAGGLDALCTILAQLPASLPATVIALQHLPPDRRSHLPAILARQTALPVSSACEGDALIPGRVLVAPSGQHTLVNADETITLIPSGTTPPYRPSADLLLTTVAIAVRHRVIAVVLSGQGNDAATGATAVHHFGGTVIATSLQTSIHPTMPKATIGRDHIPGTDPTRRIPGSAPTRHCHARVIHLALKSTDDELPERRGRMRWTTRSRSGTSWSNGAVTRCCTGSVARCPAAASPGCSGPAAAARRR